MNIDNWREDLWIFLMEDVNLFVAAFQLGEKGEDRSDDFKRLNRSAEKLIEELLEEVVEEAEKQGVHLCQTANNAPPNDYKYRPLPGPDIRERLGLIKSAKK